MKIVIFNKYNTAASQSQPFSVTSKSYKQWNIMTPVLHGLILSDVISGIFSDCPEDSEERIWDKTKREISTKR